MRMKTIQIVIAVHLLAGTAFSQTLPVKVGEEVFITSSATAVEGDYAFVGPGSQVAILEVWPSHLIVSSKAHPGIRLTVSRDYVVKDALTEAEVKEANRKRREVLFEEIKVKDQEIEALKAKIAKKDRNGTLKRKKVMQKDGGTYITLPAKEDLELEELKTESTNLTKERGQLL